MPENIIPFKHNNIPNYIRGWYIPERICDDIISYFERNTDKHEDGKCGAHTVNRSIKDSTDICIDGYEVSKNECLVTYWKWLSAFSSLYVDEFKPLSKNLQPWSLVERFNIQKYNPSQGFYSTHCENIGFKSSQRILVFQTYLNTVTDGGETEFTEHNFKTPAEKGLTVFFPAGWTHPHRGCVSHTQTKYIVTGWYSYTPDDKSSLDSATD